MTTAHITRETHIVRSPRVLQLEGMFDLAANKSSRLEWDVALPLEARPWNIGLIVGPSGCGKSTIAGELFGSDVIESFDWPADASLLDGFPVALGIKEITGLLCSVGFSSPPAWLRPFHVLSHGERFRVSMARALAERREQVVVDEFTSVVDRTVARIGSAALAKAVRLLDQKFVAVSCHDDIIEWLQPDWVYEPAVNRFEWRSLRGRPEIALDIRTVTTDAWNLFRSHHYLTGTLHPAAQCFVATVDGRLAAFTAALPFPHPRRPGWREHRTVCQPDFQGVGIGTALSNYVASLFVGRGPYFSTTSHPGLIQSRCRSHEWKMTRRPSRVGRPSQKSLKHLDHTHSQQRLTASFEYIGPPRDFNDPRRVRCTDQSIGKLSG